MNFEQLKPALEAAKKELNALTYLLNDKFGLTFSGKNCTGNTSVKIREKSNGDFVFSDFGSSYADLHGKDFAGLCYALKLKPTEIKAILDSVGISTTATLAPLTIAQKSPSPSKSAFSICGWSSPIGQKAFAYLAKKTGANLEFLQGFNIEPVATFIGSTGAKFVCNTENFKIAYPTKGGAKTVQIKGGLKSKEYKSIFVPNVDFGAFFGLNRLPTKGENLIICEGENDCICLNYFGQSTNTYAITFGGDRVDFDAAVIEDLKQRFTNIFVLFDSYYFEEKSKELAEKQADKFGLCCIDFDFITLQLFNAAKFKDLAPQQITGTKDVCEILEHFSGDLVSQFIAAIVGANTAIKANDKDAYKIAINNCLAFDFEQHISGANAVAKSFLQPLDLLTTALIKYKKVALQSAAGTGKSFALSALIDKVLNPNTFFQFASRNVSKVVICLPTLPLCEQLLIDMQRVHSEAILIKGGTKAGEIEAALYGAKVVLCSYDSSAKIVSIAGDSLFIIDEFQLLPSEFGYRSPAMQSVKQFLDNAKFSLLLSATPSYLFVKSIGAKLILGRPTITNNFRVTIFDYKPLKKANNRLYLLDFLIKKFLAARAGGAMPANTTALVKLDNSTTLEAATNYINALGLKSRCLYSGDKDVKSGNNKLLNSIQNDSTFGGEALDILFVTCFLEAGVSIKENLCVINIDTVEPSKIIQLSNRGRLDLAKGINQNISVWVCVPTPEKPQNLPHDFCVLNEFDTRVLQAKNKAALANLHHQNLNEIEQKKHKESIAGDKDFNIYFDANTNAFEANTIQIISTLESESLKGQTAELLFSRINTLDNRTTLVGIEKISTQKLDKSHALIIHLDSQKEQNKELENAFDLLFLGEENPANLLVWFGAKSKSKSLKDSISTALNFSIDTAKKDALAYFSSLAPEIQDVFSTLKDSKLSKRLDNIIFYINQSFSVKDAVKEALTNADTKIAADKLTAIQISTDARLTQNKTIKGRANINALQLANAAFDAAIKNAFARKRYNLALRPNEKPITKNYISNVINTVAKSHSVGKLIQFKECLDILNRLYCVESKRIRTDGKQETIYTLGDLKICD